LARERNEVIVVYPDEVVRFEQRNEPPREEPVDPAIDFVLLPAVREKRQQEMEQRPQGVVAEAVVVGLVLLLVQVDRRVADLAGCGNSGFPRFLRRRAAAPPEPQPALLPEGGHETDREAAGRLAAFRQRDPVRYGDQSSHPALSRANRFIMSRGSFPA